MYKYSLINIETKYNFQLQEGDVIVFEMPSFCSGDYEATVLKDSKYGLFIDNRHNYFKGCRDFEVYRGGKKVEWPQLQSKPAERVVYAMMFNPMVHESTYGVVSLHTTRKEAEEAMLWHQQAVKQEDQYCDSMDWMVKEYTVEGNSLKPQT